MQKVDVYIRNENEIRSNDLFGLNTHCVNCRFCRFQTVNNDKNDTFARCRFRLFLLVVFFRKKFFRAKVVPKKLPAFCIPLV